MRLRKIAYALASLAALAMAVGAGWRPNCRERKHRAPGRVRPDAAGSLAFGATSVGPQGVDEGTMKLVAFSLLIALVAGTLLGGRLSALADLRIRLASLAIVGFAMQVVNPPGRWPLVLLLGSFVLLSIVGIANLRTPGFAIVLIGVAMNFAVIAVNGGMPVDRAAIMASGQAETLAGLSEGRGVKHHLAGPDDELLFLADVIALPPPVAQVISLGDLFTYGGVSVIVAAGMRRRRGSNVAPVAEAGRVEA